MTIEKEGSFEQFPYNFKDLGIPGEILDPKRRLDGEFLAGPDSLSLQKLIRTPSSVVPDKTGVDYMKSSVIPSASNPLKRMQKTCLASLGMLHPSIAWNVGVDGMPPLSSSTNRAIHFSEVIPLSADDRSSSRGAFRHLMWQADIVKNYGNGMATDIANCHERNQAYDIAKRSFSDLDEADLHVDQLNNVIGRSVGYKYRDSSPKVLAMKILEHMYKNGFYQATGDSLHGYKVEKANLSLSEYVDTLLKILKKNENGL